MRSEWETVKISDIGEVKGGATPRTSMEEYFGGDIPWITPKDLSVNREKYIFNGARSITTAGFNSTSLTLLPKGTVLFSSRAPIGYIALAGTAVTTNQGFKSVVPNSKVTSNFLYYLLHYNKEKIESLGSGTTFKEVSGATMKNILVEIPTLPTQKAIAATLSCLDAKIELNNRINENLEQQAQAIFKSWFVDFDPFQDGEFVESELGLIPEGWELVKLEELVNIIDNRGKTPPYDKGRTEYPLLDVATLRGNSRVVNYDRVTKHVTKETYNSWFRSGHPKLNDILISTVGSLAELKLFLDNIGCIAQNVVSLRSKKISSFYLYEYLKFIKDDLISYDIGSVQPSIKVTHIVKHPILVPSKEYLNKYHNMSENITKTVYSNYQQNQALSSLRDTLLPKLMSGEIEVPVE